MDPTVQVVLDAFEGHVTTLRELVLVSQQQQQAVLGVKLGGGDLCAERVASLTEEVKMLNRGMERECVEVSEVLLSLRHARGLSPDASMAELLDVLTAAESEPLTLHVSCVRSLVSALDELQRLNLSHAQRGIQLLNAWAALLHGSATSAVEEVYSYRRKTLTRRRGRVSILAGA